MSSGPLDALIALLATSLGDDSARAIVTREARALSLEEPRTQEDFLLLLRAIERLGGTAGLAARLAITRIERGVPLLGAHAKPVSLPAAASTAKPVAVSEIVRMLAQTLGDEQAAAAVTKGMSSLALKGPALRKDDAVHLLDAIVAEGGTVGTVARFAKVRLLLSK